MKKRSQRVSQHVMLPFIVSIVILAVLLALSVVTEKVTIIDYAKEPPQQHNRPR